MLSKADLNVSFINFKLPPELLSHIFEFVPTHRLLDYSNINRLGYEHPHVSASPHPNFQICVSHVCRHWRNVTVSTPSLWTRITVDPRSRTQYQLAVTLLERSKSLPIDVYVCDGHNSLPLSLSQHVFRALSPADFTSLSSLLMPHLHRCRSLVMSFCKFDHMHAFLSGICNRGTRTAPNLITLQLCDNSFGRRHSEYSCMLRDLAHLGGSSHMLSTLRLQGVHVDWTQPWITCTSSLKELDLSFLAEDTYPSWSQFASILRSAPGLERLVLPQFPSFGESAEWFGRSLPTIPEHRNDPIQLPRLAVFALSCYSPALAIGLLRRLHLPALKQLDIRIYCGDCAEVVDELIQPIPASGLSPHDAQGPPHSLLSRLESFQIGHVKRNIEYTAAMLYGELQNIRSLVLTMENLPTRFLDILCERCKLPGRGRVWLPRLKTLYVSGRVRIRGLVNQRKSMGVPLRALYVEEHCVPKRDVAWLRENVDTFGIFIGSVELGSDPEMFLV